jgi:cupin fold WbuC family metalloprotein
VKPQARPVVVDAALLDALVDEGRASPRRRRNRNFHTTAAAPCQRLLNAIEPGSYVRPHRHLDEGKDEALVILKGIVGVVWFEDDGRVAGKARLEAGGPVVAVDIPRGTFHTIVALAAGSVLFEAKAGPYLPAREAEWAPFAPPEGDAQCPAHLERWRALF